MPDIVPTTKNIFVVAGDPSGDLHAANLIRALKAKDPGISVSCLGGKRMQAVCDRFIYNLVGVGAAGFGEPFKRFFLWIRLISLVRKFLEEKRPACVIAVDFYGFNHQVLGLANHRKIPVFYYVTPQVWASRPGRARRLARLAKRELVIFPFEEKIYKDAGGDCVFVGHPLLDIMPPPAAPPENRGGADYPWKIGLLPGSRPQEIKRLMPVFWKAFLQLHESFPNSSAYIFAAKEVPDEELRALCAGVEYDKPSPAFTIIREDDYAVRSRMDAALTASGTATLENAILGIPMAVGYIMPWLTWQIAKRVVTVKYISLANILAGKPVVREFIQEAARPEAIAGQIMSLLQNPERLAAVRNDLLAVRKSLGEPGAAARAAQIIYSDTFSS
ncbi:MAG: lipid-A-disaccharide synthase [Elusimicrobiales bacterium]|nr:lipid-A-disaccharide synthase [Elusimicrobiales bacterium]